MKILKALPLFFLCCLPISYAQQAVFNVSHDGNPAFCAPNLRVSGSVYDFQGSCPPPPIQPNQLTRAAVLYVGHDAASTPNVDLTDWAKVWGRIQANMPGAPWPAARGATPQWPLPRNGFTCTKFHATNNSGANVFSMSSYNTAGNLSASLSRTCGDFSMPVGGCHKEGVGAFQASFFKYQVGVATTAYVCGISAGSDYYWNMHWTDSAPKEPGGNVILCNGQGCKVAVTSNTSP